MTGMSADEPQFRKIDDEQVVFYRGEGWRCGCPDWAARRECQHVVKVAALVTLERAVEERGGSSRRQ
jgi:hypothetical protein